MLLTLLLGIAHPSHNLDIVPQLNLLHLLNSQVSRSRRWSHLLLRIFPSVKGSLQSRNPEYKVSTGCDLISVTVTSTLSVLILRVILYSHRGLQKYSYRPQCVFPSHSFVVNKGTFLLSRDITSSTRGFPGPGTCNNKSLSLVVTLYIRSGTPSPFKPLRHGVLSDSYAPRTLVPTRLRPRPRHFRDPPSPSKD